MRGYVHWQRDTGPPTDKGPVTSSAHYVIPPRMEPSWAALLAIIAFYGPQRPRTHPTLYHKIQILPILFLSSSDCTRVHRETPLISMSFSTNCDPVVLENARHGAQQNPSKIETHRESQHTSDHESCSSWVRFLHSLRITCSSIPGLR